MSKFRDEGPTFTTYGTFVFGTPFNFGPVGIPSALSILVMSMTWSGVTTSSTRDNIEIYSQFGGGNGTLAGRFVLAQAGFGNLQQPNGLCRLLPGCRGRILTLLNSTPPTYDVNVSWKLVRAGGV